MARRSKSWFISRLVKSSGNVRNDVINVSSGTDDSDVAVIAQLRREADSDASVISSLSSSISSIASFADSDLRVVAKLRNDVDSDSAKLQALETTVAGLGSGGFDSDQIVAIISENSSNSGSLDNKTYAYSGSLSTNTGSKRLYVASSVTLSTVDAYVVTAPSGSGVIIQINKNGSSLGTVTISDGANSSEGNSFSTSLVKGDYLTVDINQVGSSTAGANLYTNLNFI